MSDWKDTCKESVSRLGLLFKANPDIKEALGSLDKAAASKKALDDKTRELISLAVAATTRCDACISIHSKEALKAGASRDEVLEALSVAIGMNAGAAAVFSSRILEAFDQFSAEKK
jgi:AhpD family alkylhydroperoxidase